MSGSEIERFVTGVARSLPPSDFGSTRAIKAMAAAIAEREAAALSRIASLEGALVPFAATGRLLSDKPKDGDCWAGQTPAPCITFGHLRKAAGLLPNVKPDSEEG